MKRKELNLMRNIFLLPVQATEVILNVVKPTKEDKMFKKLKKEKRERKKILDEESSKPLYSNPKAKSYNEFIKEHFNVNPKKIEKIKDDIKDLREKRKEEKKKKKKSGICRKEKLKVIKIAENVLNLDDLLIINGTDKFFDEEFRFYYAESEYKKTTIVINLKYDVSKIVKKRVYYGSFTEKILEGVPSIDIIFRKSKTDIKKYSNILISNDEKNRLIKMFKEKNSNIINKVEEEILNIKQ